MVEGSATLTADGLPVCRVGDMYECPQHGANPLMEGSAFFSDDGKPVSRINEDTTACGAIIIAGSPTWASA